MTAPPRLMLVSDRRRARPGALAVAVAAGVPFLQLREKDLDAQALRACITQLSVQTEAADCLLSVNGRDELAREFGIGLHLPAGRPAVPRAGIGLLGRSAHDADEVRHGLDAGADYLLLGTVFESESKPGREPLGLEGLARLATLAAPTPVFAIGGITAGRIASVLAAGAHGVAVCGAILAAADPRSATRRILEELPR